MFDRCNYTDRLDALDGQGSSERLQNGIRAETFPIYITVKYFLTREIWLTYSFHLEVSYQELQHLDQDEC